MTIRQKFNQFFYNHEFIASWLNGSKWVLLLGLMFITPILILAWLDIHGHQTIEAWFGAISIVVGGGLVWAWFDNL